MTEMERATGTPYYVIFMRTTEHIVSTSLICQTCGKVADTIQKLAALHVRSARVAPVVVHYDAAGKATSAF
jgi:hypothetical protein